MANWVKKLLNEDESDNENELVLSDEDENIVEDVEDTNEELDLDDEAEDDIDDDNEDEDEEEDEVEDTDDLIRNMLQEDIDQRDNYLSKSSELKKKIDELKRQQGMD